ncbi:unnamed protein product [Malus baccata var. baccata]
MEERNLLQSMPPEPYDIIKDVEFAHSIGVEVRNNCPTVERHSWKYVSEDRKKAAMDQLLLMEEALKKGYKQWRYDVEQNGGATEQ